MVGIAQPENFSLFIRKVGYSVGLENTLTRFSDFCELYAAVPQLRHGDWLSLVHERWQLKTTNIADVFASLGIAHVSSQGIFAGRLGEAGAICKRVLKSPEETAVALRHLLGLAVLLADGDIFLNCLAAEFKFDAIPSRLTGMVLGKRQDLFRIFKSQTEREAIAAAINIERQRSNKGGASKGGRLSGLASAGLAGGLGHLGLPKAKDVHQMDSPSQDYLRHIVPSRREWARSLSLCNAEGIVSTQGWHYLQTFGENGFIFRGGEYSLRPTKFELECSRLSAFPELMNQAPRTWDYISLIARGLTTKAIEPPTSTSSNEALATQTKSIFAAYREGSQDRRMVRNELPLFVALASYMAIERAREQPLIDYYEWLRSDAPQQFGIKMRTSRTIEMGILVSTNGHN